MGGNVVKGRNGETEGEWLYWLMMIRCWYDDLMMILQIVNLITRLWRGGVGRGRVGRGGVVRAGKAPQCHTLHAQDEMKSTMKWNVWEGWKSSAMGAPCWFCHLLCGKTLINHTSFSPQVFWFKRWYKWIIKKKQIYMCLHKDTIYFRLYVTINCHMWRINEK